MSPIRLEMREWSRLTPEDTPELAGFRFGGQASERARRLTQERRLELHEFANGLHIQTGAWVGRLNLGDLQLTIRPKISGMPLVLLLRYAYQLRDFELLADGLHHIEHSPFQDLLVLQLVEEARELIARGLRQRYLPTHERMYSPRGSIDFGGIASSGGVGVKDAALPCVYRPRRLDSWHNRVLLAGLGLAAIQTTSLELRARLRRLSAQLEISVSQIELNRHAFKALAREADRATISYRPAITIIELLAAGVGIDLSVGPQSAPLKDFLFDMNVFFQRLMLRFLRESLPAPLTVESERILRSLFAFVPGFNPQGRRAPAIRPDYIVRREGRTIAVIDAKYRDLWQRNLPREMLYQLAIYAMSGIGMNEATILYPTMHGAASDARVALHDPVSGAIRGTVVLRPVRLDLLAELVDQRSGRGRSERAVRGAREEFARLLVLGDEDLYERADTDLGH